MAETPTLPRREWTGDEMHGRADANLSPGSSPERRGERSGPLRAGDGTSGAAVARARDAYRDVPILARPTWGHEISAYFFLGGVSSGAFMLGSLALLADADRWQHFARTAHGVAFATALPCAPLLIGDLGRPDRFHHMLRIWKPTSPMNLGAWTLLAHSGFAALSGAAALFPVTQTSAGRPANTGAEGRRRWLIGGAKRPPSVGERAWAPESLRPLVEWIPVRLVGTAGLPTALLLGGYTGVLLGTTSVPLWSESPLLGGLFMASSLSTGLAATTLAGTLSGAISPASEPLLGRLGARFGAAELALLGGYLATSGRQARALLRGGGAAQTLASAGAIGAGIALDLLGQRWPAQRRLLSVAGAVAKLAGGALLRTAIVGAGRVSAADRESTLAATQPSSSAPGWQKP
jgi:formate-dependent nitrite reductase membrane component NrfD